MSNKMLSSRISNRRFYEVLMPRFGRVAPTVPVTDIDHALRFYRDVLGFVVAFTNGNPVSFAVMA